MTAAAVSVPVQSWAELWTWVWSDSGAERVFVSRLWWVGTSLIADMLQLSVPVKTVEWHDSVERWLCHCAVDGVAWRGMAWRVSVVNRCVVLSNALLWLTVTRGVVETLEHEPTTSAKHQVTWAASDTEKSLKTILSFARTFAGYYWQLCCLQSLALVTLTSLSLCVSREVI